MSPVRAAHHEAQAKGDSGHEMLQHIVPWKKRLMRYRVLYCPLAKRKDHTSLHQNEEVHPNITRKCELLFFFSYSRNDYVIITSEYLNIYFVSI